MYKSIILFFFLFTIGGIGFVLSQEKIDEVISIQKTGVMEEFQVYDGMVLQQPLIGELNNLYSIGLKIHYFYTMSANTLSVSLVSGDEKIASDRIFLNSLNGPIFYQLRFDAIRDSAGKQFHIIIQTDTPKNQPLSLYVYANTAEDQNFILNDEEFDKHMVLFTRYKNHLSAKGGFNTFPLLLERISQYKPDILKGNFFIFLLMLYSILLFLFVYFIMKDVDK